MKPKYLIIMMAPLLACLIVTILAYFAAFAMTVITGQVDVLDTYSALVDEGIFNLFRFTLIIIMCGVWYMKSFPDIFYHREAPFSVILKKTFHPMGIIPLILLGGSIQIATDSILYVLGHFFRTAFASYEHMMETFEGSNSVLFIITVCTIGPVAEELLFRGLTLQYAMKAFDNKKYKYAIAVFIQAILFAVYHGNIIQSTYAFIFGLLFGAITVKAGSVLPSIITHCTVNASLYLLPADIYKYPKRAFVIMIISLLALIGSFALAYIHFGSKSSTDDDDKPSE